MKTKHIISILIIALLAPWSGIAQVTREITPEGGFDAFNTVEIEGLIKAKLEQGSRNAVFVTTPDSSEAGVKAVVKNGVLNIKSAKGSGTVHIIHTGIEALKLNSAVEVEGVNTMMSPSFKVVANGACQADLSLEVGTLEALVNGASKLELRGKADSAEVKVNGASQLKAGEFVTTKMKANISGASLAEVNVSESLVGKVSGMSSISYEEEPAFVDIDRSGSAEVVLGGLDTIQVKIGGQKVIIIDDIEDIERKLEEKEKQLEDKEGRKEKCCKFDGHWGGFELNMSTYVDPNYQLELEDPYGFLDPDLSHSIGFNLNLIEKNIPIVKDKFGLVTGLGWTFNNYRFDPDIVLRNDTSVIWYSIDPLYEKSRLRVNNLTLPLIFEVQSNSKSKSNSVHVGAGMIFGLNVGARTKNVYYDDNERVKVKQRGEFHLNPLSVSATARIGWGKLNLFASYDLLPMFKAGEGPELYPVQVGITLVDW